LRSVSASVGSSLFDQVVAASGLTPLVAPFTIRRLLLRENIVPPEELTHEQLEQAMPNLLAALRVYLDGEEHAAAAGALAQLLTP
jgi:hypothetical protein